MISLIKELVIPSSVETESIILQPSVQEYFGNLNAHKRLLKDKIRLEAYRKAIYETVKPGDVVMDIGAGTGILSRYAIEAGARRVYLVEENENILLTARRRLSYANAMGKVVFIPKRSTQLSSSELLEKCDVVISEILGSLGINEGILHTLTDAKRFLKKDGIFLPCGLKLCCALYTADDSVISINRPAVYRGISDNIELVTEPITIFNFDFIQNILLEDSHRFTVLGTIPEHDGICLWFESRLSHTVSISNSPQMPETSWAYVFLPQHYTNHPVTIQFQYTHNVASIIYLSVKIISRINGFKIVNNFNYKQILEMKKK